MTSHAAVIEAAAPRQPHNTVFELALRVYQEDTDSGGIVFHANYLRYFERARSEWLRALGLSQSRLREQSGGMFVVGRACLRWLRPARLDDALIVTAALQDKGRASLTMVQQALLESAPGAADTAHDTAAARALLAQAQLRIGWIDCATLRPARIPAQLLERIA